MPLMRWRDFMETYPKAHLLIANVDAANRNGVARRDLMASLRQLVVSSEPAGDYAISSTGAAGGGEIHIAMHKDYDAARLAKVVHAVSGGASSGWASQATFQFGKQWDGELANTPP